MRKLVVNSALMANEIIDVLDGYKENEVEIKFLEKKGVKLFFEINGIEENNAINLVKKIIKSNDWSKSLYFYVALE
ncbi:MAG: hypothetical protein GX914_04090 [Erysipelotrichia bacterium]|nr:hypothetical protein [Erysipelotrichia bacterium]